MTQLPVLSSREIIKALSKIGYRVVRQKGSHIRLHAPSRLPVTVPNYKSIDRSFLMKILRDADVPAEDFINLIN